MLDEGDGVTVWERLRQDLAARRNLDVYATVVVALGTSILAAFDIAPTSKIMSAILAVLAVLAFSTLATRSAVDEMARGGRDAGVRFRTDFPGDLETRRETSSDVYIIGVSLSRALETSYQEFEQNLQRGAKLRILLTDPEADDAAVSTQNKPTRPRPDEIRGEIRQSLRLLARLQADTSGRLEVRTTTSALKFGMNFVDASKPNALLCIQLYAFRQSGESRPIFALTLADGAWFECYRQQAEHLWAESSVVDLTAAPV
ncbi:hypothetical protein [Streptomyces regalis]|uniref:Uncharacterized protein n=1 Tax=Streptomyces regalis TaxID=68262 RepID=A0A124G7P3_9ACTN|nr:hypothetical protein [Streptomyces regalis]KUL23292.1 hypothetical protein ADL12_40215 [Streptomyces regalis]